MMSKPGAWRKDGKVHWVGGVKQHIPTVKSPFCKVEGIVKKDECNPFGGKTTAADWGKKYDGNVERQMVNFVRKCQGCGKPNAKTLKICNACGDKLPEEVTTTPNLFSCIVYGFDAVGLSVRYQDEDCLVIDDLLALSPCHINAIWARDHIPDARFLFRNPEKGLRIIKTMTAACLKAFDTFTSNEEFMKAAIRGSVPKDPMDLVACGFNTPPSQYQLHMQFIMLPLIPFQAAQLMKGVHFTKYRFCPLSFIREGLEAAVKNGVKMDVTLDTSIEEIIKKLSSLGVSYEKMWEAEYKRFENVQEEQGNWDLANFEHILSESSPEADVKKAEGGDRIGLQSYGRPYTAEGCPAATNHYKYAKRPGQVEEFC